MTKAKAVSAVPTLSLFNADVLDVLALLPDNHFDAVLSDPPYGLSAHTQADINNALTAWVSGKPYTHKAKGFMGNTWDSFVPGPEVWKEVLRVLKPGGFALIFAGSRTQDLMGMSLRLAGFELKESVLWVNGEGFPKGQNIQKQTTKGALQWLSKNNVRHAVQASKSIHLRSDTDTGAFALTPVVIRPEGERALLIETGKGGDSSAVMVMSQSELMAAPIGLSTMLSWSSISDDNYHLVSTFITETASKPITDSKICNWLASANTPKSTLSRETLPSGLRLPALPAGQRLSAGHWSKSAIPLVSVVGRATENTLKQWAGYNVCLKPAYEPALLVRKPSPDTFANIAKNQGCGALNIDACRVGVGAKKWETPRGGIWATDADAKAALVDNPLGRFPANLVLDGSPEIEGLFPESKAGTGSFKAEDYAEGGTPVPFTRGDFVGRGDSGSAARFFKVCEPSALDKAPPLFYCAKPGTKERNAGLGDSAPKANVHPTVKPVKLAQYLAALLLPPSRVEGEEPRRILVPFSGSGSECVGAGLAGWDEITGIEISAEYAAISAARFKHWTKGECDQLSFEVLDAA